MRSCLILAFSACLLACPSEEAPSTAPPPVEAKAPAAKAPKKEAPLPELKGYPLRQMAPAARRPFAEIAQEELCGCDNPRTLAGCLSKEAPCAQAVIFANLIRGMLEGGATRAQTQLMFSNLITDGMCADIKPFLPLEPFPSKSNVPLGQPSVQVVEFADFMCGHCAQAAPEFKRVLDTALPIRFHFVPMQLGANPMSGKAGKAALAAWRQGERLFWAYHDALFKHQNELNEAKLTELAKTVGLKIEVWQKDRKDPELERLFKSGVELGNLAGLKGTPYVLVNGRPLNGSVSSTDLAARIQLEMVRHRKECEE